MTEPKSLTRMSLDILSPCPDCWENHEVPPCGHDPELRREHTCLRPNYCAVCAILLHLDEAADQLSRARAETWEEAAEVADSFRERTIADDEGEDDCIAKGAELACRHIAAAIRARAKEGK